MIRIGLWLLFLFLAPCAGAQVYLGVSYGATQASEVDDEEPVPDFESDFGYRVSVGNRLSEHISIEGGATDFGVYERDLPADTTAIDDTLSALSFDLSLVAKLPFDDRFSLFSRFGVQRWQVTRTVPDPDTGAPVDFETDGVDGLVGLGLEYRFARHIGLTLEANLIRAGQTYNNVRGLGVFLTF